MRPTVAVVRPTAIEANVRCLIGLAPDVGFCAVVKADGYGHGADTAIRAALAGGASWLAVATFEEALEAAAVADAVDSDAPVLILSELVPSEALEAARSAPERIRFTVASVPGLEALASASAPRSVHLKVDTGMHRMGATPAELCKVAAALQRTDGCLHLEAAWTHLADADGDACGRGGDACGRGGDACACGGDACGCGDGSLSFTARQLRRFDDALAVLRGSGLFVPFTHAANSAGLLAHPASHHDMVRVGIAMYGVPPTPRLAGIVELRPALSLVSRVTAVRTVERGESVSYGRYWRASVPTRVATVPIGYADGVRRHSGPAGVEVLVRGRRCPMVGAVTMDQLMVAAPEDIASEMAVGDEVVLLGRQGTDEITADEIAKRTSTVSYEVLTGVSARVVRLNKEA